MFQTTKQFLQREPYRPLGGRPPGARCPADDIGQPCWGIHTFHVKKRLVYSMKDVWIYHDVSSTTMDLYGFVTTKTNDSENKTWFINEELRFKLIWIIKPWSFWRFIIYGGLHPESLDCFEGQFVGKPHAFHRKHHGKTLETPVDFPLNQSNDLEIKGHWHGFGTHED